MKILVAYNKYGNTYYDYSTPEKQSESWLLLFADFKAEGCYEDIEDKLEKYYYKRAKESKWQDAKTLLTIRQDYEYEGWSIEETVN